MPQLLRAGITAVAVAVAYQGLVLFLARSPPPLVPPTAQAGRECPGSWMRNAKDSLSSICLKYATLPESHVSAASRSAIVTAWPPSWNKATQLFDPPEQFDLGVRVFDFTFKRFYYPFLNENRTGFAYGDVAVYGNDGNSNIEAWMQKQLRGLATKLKQPCNKYETIILRCNFSSANRFENITGQIADLLFNDIFKDMIMPRAAALQTFEKLWKPDARGQWPQVYIAWGAFEFRNDFPLWREEQSKRDQSRFGTGMFASVPAGADEETIDRQLFNSWVRLDGTRLHPNGYYKAPLLFHDYTIPWTLAAHAPLPIWPLSPAKLNTSAIFRRIKTAGNPVSDSCDKLAAANSVSMDWVTDLDTEFVHRVNRAKENGCPRVQTDYKTLFGSEEADGRFKCG